METFRGKVLRRTAGFHQRDHVQNDPDAERYQGRTENRGTLLKSDLDRVEESHRVQRNRCAQPEDTHFLHEIPVYRNAGLETLDSQELPRVVEFVILLVLA